MAADPAFTQLLSDARAGDRPSLDRLFERVYHELRDIAHHRLAGRQRGETLSTTVLVHEAYLRLADGAEVSISDRAHFLALASRAMRFVLVDHARAQHAQKRGSGAAAVPLEQVQLPARTPAGDILALNDALERLAEMSERQGRLVEYRFFGGLSYEEIGDVLGISARTAKREWARARVWLYNYMQAASA
jgi:RNA polymerase sigma factor (TIGR02999 family)